MIEKILNKKIYILYILPFLLGTLTVFSFQPFNFTFINFLIIPLFFLITIYVQKRSKNFYRKKPYLSNLFLVGYLFGVGYFLAGIHWISYSLTFDDQFKYLIPISFIGLPVFLGLFFGLGNLIVGSFLQNNFVSILLFSSSLSLMDYLRSKILSGFPWNLWAYSWSNNPEILQSLPLIGFFAFNLICITFFCSPLLLVFKNKKKNISLFILFLVIFLSNYIYGSLLIKKNNENLLNIHSNEKSIYIKIISPNLDLKFNLENEDIRKNINKLIKYSDPDSKTKTLFVWPEGVFSGLEFNQINEYKNLFKKAFSKNHLLLFGINTLSTPERNYDLFNSLVVVNNNLEIKYQYNKQKLVPFGEFLPIEKLLSKIGLKKITEGHGSFLKGNKQKNFMFDKIEFLPLICYEIIFPKLSQISKTKNAIINISEDAWFGDSIGPYQHFSKAIFRAIENNVFLIRSANKGISAFIDNKGVVKKSLGPSETGAIEYKVPIINNNFLNYKIDLIFFVLLITYVLIFILLRKKTK